MSFLSSHGVFITSEVIKQALIISNIRLYGFIFNNKFTDYRILLIFHQNINLLANPDLIQKGNVFIYNLNNCHQPHYFSDARQFIFPLNLNSQPYYFTLRF